MATSNPVLATLLLLALASVSSSCASNSQSDTRVRIELVPPTDSPPTAAATIPNAVLAPETSTPAPTRRITLSAVGDVMLDRSVGERIRSDGPTVVFKGVRESLRGADFTVANLETSIADVGSPRAKGYTFRSPPAAAEALKDAGIDLVSLANNHSLDFGPEALRQTLALVESQGILAVGAGVDSASAQAPKFVAINGLHLAFLGFVDTPSEGPGYQRSTWEAGPGKPGVAWADVDGITRAVKAASAEADLVIVLLHNGVEGSSEPSSSQRAYAQAAIDAGAALVLGSHPHVLQPVERYRRGVIAFSLGNFVFDGFDGAANTSAIFEAVLTPQGVESWRMVPVSIVDGLPIPK